MDKGQHIHKALAYEIRAALNVELPQDEMYIFMTSDTEAMGYLMSMRANAGLAQRIADSLPAGSP